MKAKFTRVSKGECNVIQAAFALELELRTKQEADASTSSYCYFRTGKPLSVCSPLQSSLHHKDCVSSFHFSLGFSLFNEFSNFKSFKKAGFIHLKIWHRVLRAFLCISAVLFKNTMVVFKRKY